MKPIVIGKGASGNIQVAGSEYKNVKYIDVRNFYLDKNTEEFKPTPKGIMIPLDKVEEVAKAMLAQAERFRKAIATGPRMYVVFAEDKARTVGNKQLKISETRVFEEFARAKKFRNKQEGHVIFAFTGDFSLEGSSYVFPADTKKRRVCTFVDGVWVKQADL